LSRAHQPCPYEHCGSSDAFSYRDEECVGYCHSCATPYPSNKPTFPWAEKEYPKPEKKVDVKQREVVKSTYEGIRDLDPEVAKIFGIQLQLDADGVPVRYAFKHPNNIQYRGYNEKVFWIKDKGVPMDDLFGPEFNAGGKRIYLTEGQFDAASLYQVLGKTYPVKSLPSASISEKFIKKNIDYIKSFQEVVYAGELDEAGRRAAEKLYAAIPEKFYYVPLTKWKDANEFLQNGDGDLLKWAALKPQRYAPDNFYVSLDSFERILSEETPYEFVPTPCAGLNEMIQGHTKGGMTLYKAFPGSGKTTLFRYFQYDLLKNTDQKIAVLHLEESKSTTLRGLASYELGKNVNTKLAAAESGVKEEDVSKALSGFLKEDNLILFEFTQSDYGDIFEAALRYVRMAITVYGADYIFLDHVQRLAYMAGVEDATRNLTTFAVKIEDMCRQYNVGFNAISHVNSEGAAKYAKSLEESCIIAIDLSRDKDSEDEVEQNTICLTIPGKNRPWAKLGEAGKLFYNQDTTLLSELED
jgi:twinkle protein